MGSGREMREAEVAIPGEKCRRVHKALCDCERRVGGVACRQLNRALAECMVEEACPGEWEAVRLLCASAGTQLKRTQCLQARHSLSLCLSSLQQP